MKLFFKLVRLILSPILLAYDALFPPQKLAKEKLKQDEIESANKELSLYQFKACPFCIKVRRQSKRLGLTLETRNVLKNAKWHNELEQHGGKRKVPCLRIEKQGGNVEWLYDSKAINSYLMQRVAV